jgi:hypothetical protein
VCKFACRKFKGHCKLLNLCSSTIFILFLMNYSWIFWECVVLKFCSWTTLKFLLLICSWNFASSIFWLCLLNCFENFLCTFSGHKKIMIASSNGCSEICKVS